MSSMLRYVILRHEGIAEPHFDLMFETAPGSELATWRSDRWPIDITAPLVKLADHRAAYLDYEGPIGGDRGLVRRIEAGMFIFESCEPERWRMILVSSTQNRSLLIQVEAAQWVARAIDSV